jgi:hypothetical protein
MRYQVYCVEQLSLCEWWPLDFFIIIIQMISCSRREKVSSSFTKDSYFNIYWQALEGPKKKYTVMHSKHTLHSFLVANH